MPTSADPAATSPPVPGAAPGPAATACGKVILLGEHAVVYGVPALCGALRGGAEVHLVPGRGALRVPAWGAVTPTAAELLVEPGAPERSSSSPIHLSAAGAAGDQPLAQAFRAILQSVLAAAPADRAEPARALAVDFEVRFSIPTGAGLGSSAALAVALVRALDVALGLGLSAEAVDAAAFAAEKVFHGSPSGLDHTVAQRGGFGLFRRGQGLVPLTGTPALRLLIGHTGRARDTKGRVQRVAELYQADREGTAARFARIAGLIDEAVAALRRGDLAALGQTMNQNQAELRHLDVSCPEIDTLCELALEAGALGAKLTGGGGGGCVLALCAEREADVAAAWQRRGFTSFPVTIGQSPSPASGPALDPRPEGAAAEPSPAPVTKGRP
ncbi:MAG: mevalonate kinase [Polyangia bacterium]